MTKQELNFDSVPFDEEEAELIAALETAIDEGALVNELSPERKAEVEAIARATMNPAKTRITTRVPERDLSKLKARAMELGMPYQTLLASVIHRYVEGTLVDR